MSVLVLLTNSGVAQVFGGGSPAQTFAQWLATTNDGAGPARYWPMSDVSGDTMTASIGGINGTYQNAGDLELNITDAQSVKWVGFGAALFPGHATIATALQSAAFTAMVVVQFDLVKAKHVLLTTGGGSTPGQFSLEVVDDGSGGLKPRVFSVNASNQPVIYVGTNPGTIPVGTPCALFYVRPANGTQEVWCVTAAGTVSQIPLTLSSGTPPGSWSAQPAGTWYVGAWSNGGDPLDGVARSLALWNAALSASDINALGSISPQIQNVVWARDIDAGTVEINGTRDNIPLTPDVHPEIGFTPAIVTQGSLGTYSVNGQVLTYAAGATAGTDTQGQYKITKGGIDSPTHGITISVASASPPPTGLNFNLPFAGRYYGSCIFGGSHAANNVARQSSQDAQSYFFWADRTGVIKTLFMHFRIGQGYSGGDTGIYTFEIAPADPNTKLRITGAAAICQVNNFPAPNSGANLDIDFTLQGQVIAGQPYVLIVRNTHADPGGNYFSTNVGLHCGLFNEGEYREPQGIDPTAVGSSPAAIRGWYPVVIEGKLWYPYPTKALDRVFKLDRMGPQLSAFRYADGVTTGWGGWGGGQGYKKAVSGSNQLRVHFRVSRATRVVDGVFIRLSRINNSGGTLVVSLESGGSDTTNGTPIETVNVPAHHFKDVAGGENNSEWNGTVDFTHFVWVPFTQHRTLTLGQFYNIRLSATGGGDFSMWCSARIETSGGSPGNLTWDNWEALRTVEWTCWEDARHASHDSTNGGSSWNPGPLPTILFRCV